jgi:hypothetical protein
MAPLDVRLEKARAPRSHELQAVRVRVSRVGVLGETMQKIRIWLDHQKIQPTSFRTTADPRGYLLTLEFGSEEQAERFRQQFRTVAVPSAPSNEAIEPSDSVCPKV